MQRHIYRLIAMVLLFIGAMVVMTGHLEEITFHTEEEVTAMAEASFPTVYILNQETPMNPLYGYSANMSPDLLRESLTPLNSEQYFYAVIEEHGSRVKRLLYEVWDSDGLNMLDSGSISALEDSEAGKMAKVRIRTDLVQNEEYFVKMTVVTATGKKVRFFTRVKYLPEDHLAENLAFVQNFHDTIFEKEKAESLRTYLESDSTMDNSSFAYVNIHSSLDVVTWGNLSVEKKTEPMPVVIENNGNTTAVQLKYMVTAGTPAGSEEYFVTEYYRVQWTQNAMYLLAYERKMEAVYDPAGTSLVKGELKLGISNETDIDIVVSGENSRLCFVKERELWYYNVAENKAVKVFSFRGNEDYDKRELYDQHDIRILNMDDSGNINFMVYGYMNRGVYEGRVGIVLYRFYAGENRIEEQVYIPLETSYQLLKEDLDRLSYVSQDSVFYFSLYNTLYSYNIITKKTEQVAQDVTKDTCLVFPDKSRVVWQSSSVAAESDHLVIMDLETREQTYVKAPSGHVIKLVGEIDDNMIYGVADRSDISQTVDGTILVPMKRIVIADKEGKSLKEYEKEGIYTFATTVEENVITLERRSRDGQGEWKKEENDHILNYMTSPAPVIGISTRVTELTLTELYITLPAGYVLEHVPEEEGTDITIIHEETTLRLTAVDQPPKRYYTYIYGEMTGSSLTAAPAIAEADEKMGLVINEKNQVVWERGARLKWASIGDVTMISGGKKSASESDCIRMLLDRRYLEVSEDELAGITGGVTEVLDHYLGGAAVNLSGATMEEALYFIGRGCPVIAVKSDGSTVLLTAYDEYSVTWQDPVQGKAVRTGMTQAKEEFEKAGNIFISYLP